MVGMVLEKLVLLGRVLYKNIFVYNVEFVFVDIVGLNLVSILFGLIFSRFVVVWVRVLFIVCRVMLFV